MSKTTKKTNAPAALPGGITQEQFDKWKADHGEVIVVTVEATDGPKTAYYKPVSACAKPRQVFAALAKKLSANDSVAAGQFLARSTELAADDAIKSDDLLAIAAEQVLLKNSNLPIATLEKK